jgi:hypothetical protein
MSTARWGLAAAAVDGKIYAIGGWDGGYLRTVEEYDPKTDKWRMLAAMPTARAYLAAAAVDGKIYAIGGHDGSKYLNTVEEYIPPRESGIVDSDSFAVVNHIKAVIDSPADKAFLSGFMNVMGTAMVTEGSLNSWILDFARGEHPPSGYTPITISSAPVKDALLGTWDTTTGDDGIYTLRLRVTDANAITLETYIVVTLDNTPPGAPTVQINSPTGFDFIKSNVTITISGSTEAHVTVKSAHLLDQAGAPFKDVTSNVVIDGSGVISGSVNVGELTGITALKLGLVVQDRANNPSPQGVSNGLTVDDDKPQVSLLSPVNGAYFNKAPILLYGTAVDAISGVAKVEIHTGLGDWTPVVRNVNWTYSYTPPSADVMLTVKTRAKDKAGNEVVATAINVFYFSTMPTANISAPTDNAEVSGLVDILGDADDTDTDYSDLSYKLEYAEGADAQGGWKLIAEIKNKPVKNGLLAQWQTQNLTKVAYTLRLTVKNKQSEVEVKRRNIQVKTPPRDTMPPAAVIDLVTSNPTSDSITLVWTAPGDDGNVATATAYDIRYSDVIPLNWNTARKVPNPPTPQSAGKREEFIVTGLSPSTTYYFALKAVDEAGNWSDISNIATGGTTGGEVGKFIMNLAKGLNMVSLPLKLDSDMQAKEFANLLSATVVVQLNKETQQFEAFVSEFGWTNFPIEGGKGYIVNVLESKAVEFEGKAWFSAPNQGGGSREPVWAFVVGGEAGSGDWVLVRNTRTGEVANSVVREGRFGVVLGGIQGREVMREGDEVEVLVYNKSKLTGRGNMRVEIAQLERAVALVHIERQPEKTALLQNYPNPFNPETWIPFHLAHDTPVTIRIYNAKGQIIRILDLENREAGIYVTKDKAAYWDGKDNLGQSVASGVYYYSLQAGEFTVTRKMVMMK